VQHSKPLKKIGPQSEREQTIVWVFDKSLHTTKMFADLVDKVLMQLAISAIPINRVLVNILRLTIY
jgi:hypothetical protein